jgi:branched-chain amino acid transport system permease protein
MSAVESLLNPQLVVAALVTGGVYALLAVSLNLIYGTMRLLNVAHGELGMIGAYVAYWAFTLLEVPPVASLVGAVMLNAALGVVLYRALFRGVLKTSRNVEQVEGRSLLIFFGIAIVLQNAAALMFSGTPRGYSYLTTVLHFAGVSLTASRLLALVVAFATVAGVIAFFRMTTLGLAVRALIQSHDASALVGINIDRVFIISSAFGFALAGVAGVLLSMYQAVTPFMGFDLTIAAFVIIILGGLGNLIGSLAGGVLLGVLETFGVALTGPNYRSILIYGVFIAILLWRPQGLFGTAVRP